MAARRRRRKPGWLRTILLLFVSLGIVLGIILVLQRWRNTHAGGPHVPTSTAASTPGSGTGIDIEPHERRQLEDILKRSK